MMFAFGGRRTSLFFSYVFVRTICLISSLIFISCFSCTTAAASGLYASSQEPKTLDEAVALVQQMVADGGSRDDIALAVKNMVDNRVTNVNSLERMTDWRNWFLLFADNPKEKDFDDFRARGNFDYDETAKWLWNSQYGQCEEISSLTYYILTKAEVEGNVRILSTSAGNGHNFVVWGMQDGADPNNPDTWGSQARIVDGWGGKTLTAEDAADDQLYIQEGRYVNDNTCSYDKNAPGWETDQGSSGNGDLSSLFDCFFSTAMDGSPEAEKIAVLREFRDESLLKSPFGSKLVALYYRFSPPLASYLGQHEALRIFVRENLVVPLVRLTGYYRKLNDEKNKSVAYHSLPYREN
ncbi:MAG: hypothetical protein NUK65_11170 [Firmicutes bacterium]|nr:hypothetical protein [Bacillota bacterium]